MAAWRMWVRCTCILLFVCGVLVPVALLLVITGGGYDDLSSSSSPFLASVRGFEGKGSSSHERKPLDYAEVEDNKEDMERQVQEMRQIVVSVRNELRELEREREEVREAVDKSKTTLAKVRKEVGSAKSSLQDSKEKLARVLREMKRANQYSVEVQVTRSPVVVVNLPAESRIPEEARGVVSEERRQQMQGGVASRNTAQGSILRGERASMDCFDELCFDYSRCSLTSKFLVYVYNQHFPAAFGLRYPGIVDQLVASLELTHSLTSEPNLACIYIIITGPLRVELDRTALHQKLQSLPHWKDGSNHVVVDFSYSNEEQLAPVSLQRDPLGHGIEAGSYNTDLERWGYDILIPPVTFLQESDEPLWKNLPFLVPALREVLVHFEGAAGDGEGASSPLGTHWITSRQLRTLSEAITSNTKDKVVILTSCTGTRKAPVANDGGEKPSAGEWELCGTPQGRAHALSQATFSLVIGSRTGVAGPVTYSRLVESLRYGAVPVILGLRRLPLDSVIDWQRAAVILPVSSLGELHFVLRNMDADTVLQYRKQGRFLWETYFSSPLDILKTVVAVMRQRAKHPPPPANGYTPTNLVNLPGENRVILSPEFLYNFTSYTADFWNSPPGPFLMYPTTPFKPQPVSGSQYANMNTKQISNLPPHVVEGGGITGPFFEDYLLGNVPEEQFTVVVLTYERNDVVVNALLRLKDLDHLAKVVVVWNNADPPPGTMKWPELGIPVDVVTTGRNSLNNRFLPFSNIQTEAVLSLDDDVHLRHDEIQFAFRVWREARDRVVGFPGRFHAWDSRHPGWLYNSNYTCELSMVLTGAAFLHKYYMFLYSQWLYSEARDLVDKYVNCEDIAINFLVSHITRKPPLKVTSRWTFRCPGCPDNLSKSDEHFEERHVCMNQLVAMFGYMPLLYTQFRLDSVLFKTRLPSHLEKCYEFI